MIRLFATHKTAANLLMLALLAVGLLALPGLKRETFPQIPVDEIEIRVVYAGATPADIEDAICRRIEAAIDGVEDIDDVRSEALESVGVVTVQVVGGTDAQVVATDLRTEIDAIDDFPAAAEDYVLRLVGRTENVVALAVVGDMPPRDLKARCEDLAARLVRESDIEIVEVLGFSDHQIRIEVPAITLMRTGIAAADITAAVARQSVDLPAGSLQTADGDVVVRFTDERRAPAEFDDLVVLSSANGAEIRLGDIARVTDVFQLDEDKFLFDGRRAGLLQIKKSRAQDALVVVDAVQRFVARERAVQPRGTDLILTQDTSSIVRDRLQLLIVNGWQGLLLVFITLWLFFSARLAFWVAMGLPVAFLGALFFMTVIGFSINMLTMVALLLALGLLMDDAIVLAENVASHLARGKSSVAAAVDGVREVGSGVFSSFLTTVVVFGPLSFLDGDIGAVLKVIPVVLILVLAVSLVEAFLDPARPTSAHSLREHQPEQDRGGFRRRFERTLDRVRPGATCSAASVDGAVRVTLPDPGSASQSWSCPDLDRPWSRGGQREVPGPSRRSTATWSSRACCCPRGRRWSAPRPLINRSAHPGDRAGGRRALAAAGSPSGAEPGGRSVSVQHNVNIDAKESGSPRRHRHRRPARAPKIRDASHRRDPGALAGRAVGTRFRTC